MKQNPQSLIAQKELAIYYKDAQQPRKRLKLLEKIVKFAPEQGTIEDLSSLYKDFNILDKHISMLKSLIKIKNNKVTEEDYKRLIVYTAAQENYQEALDIIDKLLEVKGKDISADLIHLAIEISLGAEDEERAYTIAKNFSLNATTSLIERIISLFIENQKIDIAEKLVRYLRDTDVTNEDYFVLELRLMVGQRNTQEAFVQLHEYFSNNELQAKAMNLLALLALDAQEITVAKQVLDRFTPDMFSDKVIIEYIEHSIMTGDKELVEKLKSKLSLAYLRESKVIATLLAFSLQTQEMGQLVRDIKKSDYLSSDEKLLIMNICYEKGKKQLSYEIQKTIPIIELLINWDPFIISEQILNYGEPEAMVGKMQKLMNGYRGMELKAVADALLTLTAGIGNRENLKWILTKHPNLTEYAVNEAFFTADRFKQIHITHTLSTLFAQQFPESETNITIAESLLEQKKYKLVLHSLDKLYAQNPYACSLYMSALTNIFKENPAALTNGIGQGFQHFAKTLLLNPTISRERLRDYGYFYSGIKHTAQAREIFYRLSDTQKTVNKDVLELMFLLGDNLADSDIQWLVTKAAAAEIGNKIEWFKILNQKKLYKELITLIRQLPEVTAVMMPQYLDALYNTGKLDILELQVKKLQTVDFDKMPRPELIQLVGLFHRINYSQQAEEVFKLIPKQELITSENILDTVELFKQVGKGDYGLALLREQAGATINDASIKTSIAWAMLAACTNKQVELNNWLDSTSDISLELLNDCYYLAFKYNHDSLAVDLARQLHKRVATPQHTELLADALIRDKQYKVAIELIISTKQKTRQTHLLFLHALNMFLEEAGTKLAREYIADFALTKKYLLSPESVTDQLKRGLGYLASGLEMKSDAQKIFWQLSEKSAARSPDIEQLIFLSEGNISPKLQSWIVSRANVEVIKGRRFWLKIMNDNKMAEETLDVVKQYPGAPSLEIIDQYIRALYLLGHKKKFETELGLIKKESLTKVSFQQLISLIKLYSLSSQKQTAKELFLSLPMKEVMAEITALEAANLFIICGNVEEGLEFLQAEKVASPRSRSAQTWVFLSVYLNKQHQVLTYIKKYGKTVELTQDSFNLALEYKHIQLALTLIELLVVDNRSEQNLKYLAELQILNNQASSALLTIASLDETNLATQQLYLTAVAGIMEQQGQEAVKPYRDKAIKMATKILATPDIDPDNILSVGYFYSDIGLTTEAREIFFKLAQDKGPTSAEVEQLIYLWGKKKWPQAGKWLEERARQARGAERLGWLKHLNTTGNATIVVQIMESEEEIDEE